MSPSNSPKSFMPSMIQVEDRPTPLSGHRRQASSTGGGRAWSEEEESYLIETRQHKMPYKHIAAHLQKTELACRLHYHQLSLGAKRRRRNSSISSVRSVARVPSSSAPPTACLQQELPPPHCALSNPQLPIISPPASPSCRDSSPLDHISILPKPHFAQQQQIPTHSVYDLPQPTPSSRASSSASATSTIFRIPFDPLPLQRINRERLTRAYAAHRFTFWTAVAREYGDGVAPSLLEDAWRKFEMGGSSHYPPTPPFRSPERRVSLLDTGLPAMVVEEGQDIPSRRESLASAGSRPPLPRAARSSFTISELLTEDREVRSTGEKR